MTRRQLQQMTDRQLQIMRILWDTGHATVAEVHDALGAKKYARKTIGTLLSRLEEQGLITHRIVGREFVYRTRVTREEVARAKVRSVLALVLGGSVPSLVRHALEADEVAPGDVERIEEMLRHAESERSCET